MALGFLAANGIDLNSPEVSCCALDERWHQIRVSLVVRLVAYCWLLFTSLKCDHRRFDKIYVLNFLPLWNPLFFLLVPKRILLAPLTGGVNVNRDFLYTKGLMRVQVALVRNFFIPILNRLSRTIIISRKLNCVGSTPFNDKYLRKKNHRHFYISCGINPERYVTNTENLSYHIIVYTRHHPLKNNEILMLLIEALAKKQFKIALIDPQSVISPKFTGVKKFGLLTPAKVLSLICQSRAALVPSLEEAGLFAQEAAMMGRSVFCFPETGASMLPGAIPLCSDKQNIEIASMINTIARNIGRTPNATVSENMRKAVDDAKKYYTSCL